MPTLYLTLIKFVALVMTCFFVSFSNAQTMQIELSQPTFILPQFTGPYREREASVAPEEYETAERLRSLLDNNQTEEVLKELNGFYDLELSPAMLTLKAQVYFSLKRYDDALRIYQEVLARKPELVRVHADLGQLYLIRQDYNKAREHFAKAESFGSNSPLILGQLGYINLMQHGAFSAISSYQQAMALEPENQQWQQGLLAALTQAKMYPAASALLQELLEKRPNDAQLWLNKAALALSSQMIQDALVALEMAILLGEDNNKNIKTAAQLHLQLNSFPRALELISQHIKSTSLNMSLLNEYLMWLEQTEMWTYAEQLLNEVEPQLRSLNNTEQSMYYSHQARIQQVQHHPAQAEHFYVMALDKNPTDGETLLSYADFSISQKQYVRAELLYMRAEGMEKSSKQALLGRAQLYILTNDFQSALIQLKRAFTKFPELYELKDKIETIENIVRAQNQLSS
jgi:tetratricopeptide (TPR) repeat protein